MATKIAIAQRQEAALARVTAAAAKLAIQPPPAAGKYDAASHLAATLEWAAEAMEQIAAQQEAPAPKPKKAPKEAEG